MKTRSVTWSIMHPMPLDLAHFRRVAEAAEVAAIGAFEICGDCHGTQSGLDGLYGYDEYPEVLSGLQADEDRSARLATRL